MNKFKQGNYTRVIAFFLVAVTLICTFGFAAEGWQPEKNEDDSGKIDNSSDETDNNKENAPSSPEIYVPEFINVITGLETTEELSRNKTICFVMDATSPLYGISDSDMIIELPTEDGNTRLSVFTSNYKILGKVGSITKTRGYISNLAKYFGAILISTGYDDTVDYESADVSSSHFDLSQNVGYHYTEYTHFTYTNGALITAGLSNTNIGAASTKRTNLPYIFNEFGNEKILGSIQARSVTLHYSDSSETALYYSDSDSKYIMSRNGTVKTDMLTDSAVSFDNAFVLFSDSVTYESSTSSQLVLGTSDGGDGYYFTEGTAIPITWVVDASGNMKFLSEKGEALIINRGTSYIGFMKSSMMDKLTIS